MLKTTEQALKPKEQPCIFGTEIKDPCPVRKELGEHRKSDINKWIKPKAEDKFFEDAEGLLDKMTDAMHYEYHALVDFCGVCPFLAIYIAKRANP